MEWIFDNLPVYQDCFELLVRISDMIHSFPREYKYTFGEYLQKYCAESLSEISLATMITDKKEKIIHIEKARQNIELLKVYWRVCKEVNILPNTWYVSELNQMVSISKQINSRLTFCKSKIDNDR